MKALIFFIGAAVIVLTILNFRYICIKVKNWALIVNRFFQKKGTDTIKDQLTALLTEANSALMKVKTNRANADTELESARKNEKRWQKASADTAKNGNQDLETEYLQRQNAATDWVNKLQKHVDRLRNAEKQLQDTINELQEKIDQISSSETEVISQSEADRISTEVKELLDNLITD